jgi:pyruvate dehydrogenase E2 component (dihydrolipoyllysine-residue acetyltransferase)
VFSERTISALDLRIRIIEADPTVERDDPVVMVHGLAGWAENWRDVMPQVADSGRRAIAFDIPGFGQSERPKGARYFDPERPFYAPLLFAILDALAIPRAHVVGHSFGGAIAYTGAVWCPERVRSLTLIAPGGLGTDLDRSFRILTLPGMGVLARIRRSERITREILYACFHDPRRCSEQLVREAIRYGAPSVPEMVSALRSAVTFRHGVREDVRRPWISRRDRYTGPALVVWGREDRILPVAHLDEARQLSARTEAHVIGSCGHFVMAERPAELLEILLPFLDRSAQ